MSPIFADTSFYAAIVNRRDQLHARAAQAAANLAGPILTTEFVLLETANFCTSGMSRTVFLRLIDNLRRSNTIEIVPATTTAFQQGLELFAARPDQEWSLTDCISFQLMRERGLSDALTADKHFEQAGYRALLR